MNTTTLLPDLLAEQIVLPFGFWELVVIAVYLLSLVGIGAAGYRARKSDTLKDFYLAGTGVSFFVLLMTLFATQYSGNTLFAFSGKTYAIGLSWIMCLHFMTAIVVFYLVMAPKMYGLSSTHHFVTPGDFVQFRFGNRALTVTVSVVMIIAISNYLVAQLMAMGRALQGISDNDPFWSYVSGVVILATIIVIYETLGGFRAVAWTDVLQGTTLMVGFVVLLMLIVNHYGPLDQAIESIARHEAAAAEAATGSIPAREDSPLLGVPGTRRVLEWFSYVLLVGLGAVLYPQAIQRIYAANSPSSLKNSLACMAFMPLLTTLVVVVVGIYGLAHHWGLPQGQSDTILTLVFQDIQRASLLGRWVVCLLFAAILAALMSTADSVLLSISSMFTKDIYAPLTGRTEDEKHLTQVGKVFSWLVIGSAVIAALLLYELNSLVALLDKKFDLLVQLVPAFLVALHWKRLDVVATWAGLIAGLSIAIGLNILWQGARPFGVHPGLIGLAVNLALAIGISLARGRAAHGRPAQTIAG